MIMHPDARHADYQTDRGSEASACMPSTSLSLADAYAIRVRLIKVHALRFCPQPCSLGKLQGLLDSSVPLWPREFESSKTAVCAVLSAGHQPHP